MIRVVTGWSPAGYREYAKACTSTFRQFWPKEVEFVAYTEEPEDCPGIDVLSLSLCEGVDDFISKYIGNPTACGHEPVTGWRQKEIDKGYSYRFDAVKFCRQMFIPEHAALDMADGDILVWLDADVITHKKVPLDFVPGLLGYKDICYLGRGSKHSEIGFWAVRLSPITRDFLMSLAQTYRTAEVFKLAEWHSAFVFDACLKAYRTVGLKEQDLTPNGRGHVWFQSELAFYMDHLKGDQRKKAGRSGERRG